MQSFAIGISLAVALFAVTATTRGEGIVVNSPGFDTLGGRISGTLDLNALNPAPTGATSVLGSSGWYGSVSATTLGNLGFRPGIEVNQTGSSPGKGMISYGLGVNLGGLLGWEMPDSYLWQPLDGVSFATGSTYVFSIDVEVGSLLDVTALGNRGFGIGLTVGATNSSPGAFVADSLSSPALLSISAISATAERLVLTWTTGSSVPAGDIGLVVFGGRGSQALSVALLNDYRVDDVTFASATGGGTLPVPEPSAALLLASGLAVLAQWSRHRRATHGARAQAK